jgi:hypothetical protein
MPGGSHVQLAALQNRDLELQTTSPFSNHGSVERQVVMVQFLSVFFFFGILQFLLGFSKVPIFLCHPVPRLLRGSGRTVLRHLQTARSVCATAGQTGHICIMALNTGKAIELF